MVPIISRENDFVFLLHDFRLCIFEIETRGDFFSRLIQRIINLLLIDFRSDVEGRHGLGIMLRDLDVAILRLELERREGKVGEWFEQEVRQAQAQVFAELAYQLNRAASPSQWWGTDLPYLLRRELVKLTAALSA